MHHHTLLGQVGPREPGERRPCMPFDPCGGDDRTGERDERRPPGRCAPSQVEQVVSQYHQYREHKGYPARDPSEIPEAPDLEQRG